MSPALSCNGGSTKAASQGKGDVGQELSREAVDEALVEASGEAAFCKIRDILRSPIDSYSAAFHACGDANRIL